MLIIKDGLLTYSKGYLGLCLGFALVLMNIACDALARETGEAVKIAQNPLTQRDYIKAFNTNAGDEFGASVAVSGNTLVVGAIREDSNGTGADGNPSSNNLGSSGAVYVFVRNNGVWTQEAYLKAANPDVSDLFGQAVAIDGDTLVVGAGGEDSSTTGVNPVANDNASASGAAYVFTRNDGVWTQSAFLKASNTGTSDNFGASVDISGNTIVVGALAEDSSSMGVDNGFDNNVSNSGAAYVFVNEGGEWTQQAFLKASNTDTNDQFGRFVAIDGDTIVATAPFEDSDSEVINGEQSNNNRAQAGAAYVFVRSNEQWVQQAYLKAPLSDVGDQFGASVAINGDRIAIGAIEEDGGSIGLGGDLLDNSAVNAGAVYVFDRNASGAWRFLEYVKATNTGRDDFFGFAVSLSDNFLLVGANLEDSNSQMEELTRNAGAAYLYQFDNNSLLPGTIIKADKVGEDDQFGRALAMGIIGPFIGAQFEDGASAMINGEDGNNDAPEAGAVYSLVQDNRFHSIGGVVTGLVAGNAVVLQNNEDDVVTVNGNGVFRFRDLSRTGDSYQVMVAVDGQPDNPRQDCMVENGNGIVGSDGVANIIVDCTLRTLTIANEINTVESAVISVPIQLAPEGLSLAGVSFALDYDPTCLNPDRDNDGVLDRVVLNVPADFETNVFFDPSNIDGEISIAVFDFTQPFSALGTADIATVDFFVDCPAAVPFLQTNIRFGDNPPPSFSDLAGQDVEGTTAQGSVRVWDGIAGDCNVNGQVTIADVISVGREVGDDDGDVFTDAPNDEFFGSPQGCDANGNELITVADAICAHLLSIEQPCSPLRLAAAQQAQWHVETQHADDILWLQFELIQPAAGVAGVSFDLNFDLNEFDSSLFDLDRDGVPDYVRWPQGEPNIEQLTWTESETTGRLQGLLLNTASGSGQTPANLPEQLVLEVGFPTAQIPEEGIRLGERGVSFSSALGQDVHGFFSMGDVIFQDHFE